MAEPVRVSIGARRNPETETAVLDAAQAIIAEEGFARLTIEAVARRARSGKATIYRWWPGRGHLLLALYSRSKTTLPQPDTGSLKGDLDIYVAAMIRQWHGAGAALGVGQLFRLLIAEAQQDDGVRAAMQQERETRWTQLDNMMQHARDRGELNPALSPRAAVNRVVSLMIYRLLMGTLPPESEAPALVAEMLAGLTDPAG